MSEKKDQSKRRLQLAFAIAVLIGAIILLFAMERAASPTDEPPPPDAPKTGSTTTPPSTSAASPSTGGATMAATPVVEPGPTPTRAFLASPEAPPLPQERSPLADVLNAPDQDARHDLAIVASLLTAYVDHFHELPVGDNAEITAALAGDNPRGLAVIPASHPAINAAGELVDRWGTPFFFHQMGDGLMQVRSAGPDRHMYTDDDLLVPPPTAGDSEPQAP